MQLSVTEPLTSVYKEVSLDWVIPKGLKVLCEPLPPTHKYKIFDSPVFTTNDPTIKWKLFFNAETYEDGNHPLEKKSKENEKSESLVHFDNLEKWCGDEGPMPKARKQFIFGSLEVEKINDAKMDVFVDELHICCATHKKSDENEIICEIARGGIECRWIEMRSKNPVGTFCKFAKHSPIIDSGEPSKTYPKHLNCDIIFRFRGKIYTGN